ncbi:MAG TPA: YebC/PmpR family DNA-binding transcriptional regulator [Clostridia bacterium]|jgi:YebC/PmpR family DNA-binding regulatory protein|nr:YebC/PmpR family DNA-binding transcriptional regulator [Clostridia bacterium]
MAGHSKWANIQHRKSRQDAKKGQIFTKLGRAISVAAKEGGSDPAVNPALRDAIAKAKAQNMPNDTIERAIKRGSGELGGADYQRVIYEGYGPGGVAVIVEALTENRNRTAGDVRHAFDKNGGNLGTTGCVSYLFEKKGQIIIEKTKQIDDEQIMMLAIDAGALDVEIEEEGYTIITSPEDFGRVLEVVQKNGLEPMAAEVAMVPNTTVTLTDQDDIKYMNRLIDMLEDNDDIQNVYNNWDMPDE